MPAYLKKISPILINKLFQNVMVDEVRFIKLYVDLYTLE